MSPPSRHSSATSINSRVSKLSINNKSGSTRRKANAQRRGTKKIDHEMDIGEEYVEQFCPVEEPLKSNRFVDESD